MIAIGNDHGAFQLKKTVLAYLDEQGIAYHDFGAFEEEVGKHDIDYPDYAKKVTDAINSGECDRGVLLCGTGIGMSICANKAKGIRACACSDTFSARMTRAHNNANVLCMGERVVGAGLALDILKLFLETEFEGGRHERRVEKIEKLEG